MMAPPRARGGLYREDPELGTVRICRDCAEEWPLDSEFWHFQTRLLPGGRVSVIPYSYCRACWADRGRSQYPKERHA